MDGCWVASFFLANRPELTRARPARRVELSEGLPFAALTELGVSVERLGRDLEAAARRQQAIEADRDE